jgi:2,3-dihydroxybenzoate decarboxylase
LPAAIQFGAVGAEQPAAAGKSFKRIATEEAMAIPEVFEAWQALMDSGADDEPGFRTGIDSWRTSEFIRKRLLDLDDLRIREMDAAGISMQILSITSPGPQVLDAAQGVDLAKKINDRLAEVVDAHPDRFAALAAVAPQAPREAARELERAIQKLGFKGVLINSHTKGEYLDDRKFWPILETAQALDVPIYIHPRELPPHMLKSYEDLGLHSFGWGFATEVSLHAMRLIVSGVFDEFPGLKIIIGHMGERIPYWLQRMDGLDTKGRIKKLPSEYFKDNFMITTSGVPWHPAFMLAYEVLGADRIMFAVDYPWGTGEECVKFMDTAPIPDSDREKIYHLNAEKIFRL